jgi:two-component system CheB/CheR fusion protein
MLLERQGERFVFRTALRRAMIFGRHDLTQTHSISRLDLLICRNTLIYFTSEAQGGSGAVALRPNDDGYLSRPGRDAGDARALFSPIDVRHRIFTQAARLQLVSAWCCSPSPAAEATNQVSSQLRARELISEGTPVRRWSDSQGFLITANAPRACSSAYRKRTSAGQPKDLEISYKPTDLRSPIDLRRPGSSAARHAEHPVRAARRLRGHGRHQDTLIDDDGPWRAQ